MKVALCDRDWLKNRFMDFSVYNTDTFTIEIVDSLPDDVIALSDTHCVENISSWVQDLDNRLIELDKDVLVCVKGSCVYIYDNGNVYIDIYQDKRLPVRLKDSWASVVLTYNGRLDCVIPVRYISNDKMTAGKFKRHLLLEEDFKCNFKTQNRFIREGIDVGMFDDETIYKAESCRLCYEEHDIYGMNVGFLENAKSTELRYSYLKVGNDLYAISSSLRKPITVLKTDSEGYLQGDGLTFYYLGEKNLFRYVRNIIECIDYGGMTKYEKHGEARVYLGTPDTVLWLA